MTDVVSGSRRERVRASTVEEIKRTARRLLREGGVAAMSLRAIARDMGMTAPALYRYYASHEELAADMVGDLYDELADLLYGVRDAVPAERPQHRLIYVAFTFRDWSVANPREFALVFGSPLPALATLAPPPGQPPHPVAERLTGMRFGLVFAESFLATWQAAPFPVPADDTLPPALVPQLAAYRGFLDTLVAGTEDVPLTAIHVFLQCWVQLYGLIAMEVFDHLHFCLDDVGPFFQAAMDDMGARLGLDLQELHRMKQAGVACELHELREQHALRLTPAGL